jgi:mannan endo-1,4-beta-mannosidase
LNFTNGDPQFEGGAPNATPPVLPGFMISGANAVRSLVYANGTMASAAGVTAQLAQIVAAKQVPILCLYTTPQGVKTGGDVNPTTIANAAVYWVSIAAALKPFEKYMFLNIANEWGPQTSANAGPQGLPSGVSAGNTIWATAYKAAIASIRAAGILCPIVVDAASYGQDWQDLGAQGAAVVASDPQQNTLMSLHLYGNAYVSNNNFTSNYVSVINTMAALPFPVIIGEFANASPPVGTNVDNPSPTQVTEQQILAATLAAGVGCLAWAWDNNNLPGAMSDDTGFGMTTGIGGIGPGNYTGKPAELTTYGKIMVADWAVNAKQATIY